MAGHSKWANIKRKKEKTDAKKGKVFTRAAKEIINAVKHGGPDPKGNPHLRLAIQKAKTVNFPSDNIDRLIKKASSAEQEAFHFVQYELYGHGGVGIIVDALTDNKHRTASDIRGLANKRGAAIAVPGAVAFNFDRKGVITILKQHAVESELFEAATEAGAEDFQEDEDSFIVLTDPSEHVRVKDAIEKLGFLVDDDMISMIPKVYVEVSKDVYQQNKTLIDQLEELDDVDVVFHNMKEEEV